MTKYSFTEEQKTIDEAKRRIERKSDAEIEQIIKNLSGEQKALDEGRYLFLHPLVSVKYEEGQDLTKEQTLELVRYASFPHKKLLVREIRAGRVAGKVRNRKVRIDKVEK